MNKILLKLEGISKKFGVVDALNEISFSVAEGEIHTILGENGAGKSTLMKIINGELQPDSGNLIFEDKKILEHSPLNAGSLGIAMVHQELKVFENLTVSENIYPNNPITSRLGIISKKAAWEKTQGKLSLFHLDISPGARMMDMSMAEQQVIEILRAISSDRKLIILDEPTSGLNSIEVNSLISILKQLRDEGISILYITHRLPEVIALSDRITVLKDGQYVDTVINKNIKESELITKMVGREMETLYSTKIYSDNPFQDCVLEVKNINKRNVVENISFSVCKKEILGVFGLEGSGTTELARIIFGIDSLDEGEISIKGDIVKNINPGTMLSTGIAYLNKNRKEAGLFMDMTIRENVACPVLSDLSKRNLINNRKIDNYTLSKVEQFKIIIADIFSKPNQLSGGNQQRLMFSTCLGTDPDCIIINEPTRGIDVGAKSEIHRFILGLAENNTAIIIFSSELPELISLCDRILIMNQKKISGILQGTDITEESIMAYAAGSINT